MKICPKCGIRVGGHQDFCPLCQGELVGEASPSVFPAVEPAHRRGSLAYRIVAFCLLAVSVICVTVDMLSGKTFHWSLMVVLCTAVILIILRLAMVKRLNLPRLLFQLLLAVSGVVLFCDWFTGWRGFSMDLVVPTLCTITLIFNFILAFSKKHFAENSLIYLLMNIGIGVLPYLLLFLRADVHPAAWVVCLVVSILTFLGLVVFKGRELLTEFQKRLHL
jgi:hypothetical protein